MVSRFLSAVLVGAVMGVGWVEGKTIIVNSPHDDGTSTDGCPGTACTLRAAWHTAGPGDTILLTTSPRMAAPIREEKTTTHNHTLKLVGGKGINIRPKETLTHTIRFLAINNWPWSSAGYLELLVKDLTISGFGHSGDAYTGGGVAICLAMSRAYCVDEAMSAGTYKSDKAKGTGGNVNAKSRQAQGGFQRQMLTTEGVVLEGLVMGSSQFVWGGAVFVECNDSDCPVTFSRTVFRDVQVVSPYSGIGLAFYCTGSSPLNCPLTVNGCSFVNITLSGVKYPSGNNIEGSLLATYTGDIAVSGSEFNFNTVGGSRAIIIANDGDVNVSNSVIFRNGHTTANPVPNAAAISGSKLHLSFLTIDVPGDDPVTYSPNDQYLSGVTIVTQNGGKARLNGYQIYNRNPSITALTNGTGLGFADCEEAADWLPCPSGLTCHNLFSGFTVVGYHCQ